MDITGKSIMVNENINPNAHYFGHLVIITRYFILLKLIRIGPERHKAHHSQIKKASRIFRSLF